MFFEIAQIEIKEGANAAFEAGVAQAKPLFLRAKGCHGVTLQRSVEFPNRYRLFVEWETVENHMVDFRGSEDFAKWRELVGPHFASPPVVEHTYAANIG
ncbi:antibiotic biosynthesis monooxygenase family protein [Bordetella genomosp. 9]|uniref:Antibiotic biosynthesis monooxygenase n=1 Tax=Bordetella genomosp. 9 TaxID=1416803 RepID=A0A1W6YVQ9_9BORD|nr:antibiotic biosynthesis monooxygenase family protein [Bordetella genomosp. 9]ARP85177.1 antibiotic biosynthesis monooxygenase [Bordetella genomosp. 9]